MAEAKKKRQRTREEGSQDFINPLLVKTKKTRHLKRAKEKKLYYVLKNPTSLKHLTCPQVVENEMKLFQERNEERERKTKPMSRLRSRSGERQKGNMTKISSCLLPFIWTLFFLPTDSSGSGVVATTFIHFAIRDVSCTTALIIKRLKQVVSSFGGAT